MGRPLDPDKLIEALALLELNCRQWMEHILEHLSDTELTVFITACERHRAESGRQPPPTEEEIGYENYGNAHDCYKRDCPNDGQHIEDDNGPMRN